ncbi:MAG TPA: endopeptidase La [Rectinemataceae bacterium]|nr:endopeptidase La [Rectinemataceae bacterium]
MSLLEALTGGSQVELPLVHVRDIVVFPNSIAPLLVSTKFSIAATDEAARGEKRIVVALLKGAADEKKAEIEVHGVGTVVHIVQQLRLPDGSLRLLVEGERRVKIRKNVFRKDHMAVVIEPLQTEGFAVDKAEVEATIALVKRSFAQYAELARKIPQETQAAIERATLAEDFCDLVGNALLVKAQPKQLILETEGTQARLETIAEIIESEIEVLTIQRRISGKVRTRIDRQQKEYFLQEQLKEINRELGKEGDESESVELEKAIVAKNPPPEVLAKAKKELARLAKLQAFSPEAGVLRYYCEWLADLPWSTRSEENRDLEQAARILDEDHFGMEKTKERILEHLAARILSGNPRSPILCLVGPPGTGKTSLGRSIARSLGRNFIRVSLGGLRDEAEIRGHRKTYVGALPGKILQSMRKAGTVNPVFLLDEIDKMSSDFRGDPASALLEVLDPEQNGTFVDHYLELPYDLSDVMFVTTANSLNGIPLPLIDRMEIIEIPGYSEFEKLAIAKRYIVPKAVKAAGFEGAKLAFREDAILEIIRHYTMESGVRNLEREISRLVRKLSREAVAQGLAEDRERLAAWSTTVTAKRVEKLLGKRRRDEDLLVRESRPGVANGLAWTESGGTMLPIEAALFSGDEGLILTGNLGDVMKESARAALTYIRAHAASYGLAEKVFAKKTIHIHVPEGAIPKDGPSAGIALTAALLSALSGVSLRAGIAMTGEITLTGRVLAIGGVKEKVLAAHRNGIAAILLPEGNRKDLEDIPKEVRDSAELHFVETIDEAVEKLFPLGSFPEMPKA